jgi:hypothetical protein
MMTKCTDKNCPPLPAWDQWKERGYGIALFILAVYVGLLLGDRRWPYPDPQTTVYTPVVDRGGDFEMGRRLNYLIEDCALKYNRLMLSAPDPTKGGAIRRIDLEPKSFESSPDELNGKLWYIKETVPKDFPCGPAKLVDSPSAACGWFQRTFWWQSRRDAVTNFMVRCEAGHEAGKVPG